MVKQGELLWTPSKESIAKSNILKFINYVNNQEQTDIQSYDDLWRWSIKDIESFWRSFATFADVKFHEKPKAILGQSEMPGAEWFPGATLNFAEHTFRYSQTNDNAFYTISETGPLERVSWAQLEQETKRLALGLKALGVNRGDRVAAILPNIKEALVCFLAVTSLGAIWSCCAPEFGTGSITDRFLQISPKVLFASDGYVYGGKVFDRRQQVKEIVAALPSVEKLVWLPHLERDKQLPTSQSISYYDIVASVSDTGNFSFEAVPFDHPLWVVYSSGTTGLPKPIVHGHGGITIELLKLFLLHADNKVGEVGFFYTTTGWIMWNLIVSGLLVGTVPVLYDGNPAYPAPDTLWRIASETEASSFGASPSFVQMTMNTGIVPNDRYDYSQLRSIMLTGSPATPESMQWLYDNVKRDLWVMSQSGGTDIASGFVGASPLLPVHAGEIQTRLLGVDVCAFNDAGQSVVDKVGELVVRQPMPSMPLHFLGDPDMRRYKATYFEQWPGIWRHGDFLEITEERGGCIIHGRSDSTLNRFGVRIGTAEIYRTVEQLDEIRDSLIVNLELPDSQFFMPLFVVLRDGCTLTDELKDKIARELRSVYSPRHVPDFIQQVSDIPYTITGKKTEVPVKRILSGITPSNVISADALRDPQAINAFVEFSKNYPYQCFEKSS